MANEKKAASRVPMITASRIGWTKDSIQKLVLDDKDSIHNLFHVVGSASQAIVKNSDDFKDRESIEFRGSFLAVDAETGEQFKSGKLYLPSLVEAELAAQVQQNGLVEITLTVQAEYSQKAPASYSYGVESYAKEDNTAFESQMQKIPGLGDLLKLEAPAGEKADAPKGGKGGKKGGKK